MYPNSIQSIAGGLTGFGGNTPYTVNDFLAYYPQFKELPTSALQLFVDDANNHVFFDRWGAGSWTLAMHWYVAHYAEMYRRQISSGSESNTPEGLVTMESAGDVTYRYDQNAVVNGIANWGDFLTTNYGRMYATRAKLLSAGGVWI
jgi:hypothetical protein